MDGYAKRRKQGSSGRPFERIKAEIKRNATECGKCHKPISAAFRYPHPNSVTVGHIVPLIFGGDPLDPSNMQAECIACNSGEGGRIRAAQAKGLLYLPPENQTYRNPDAWS